jgi:DNA polymerase-3 subunit gamma/tau
MESRHIDVMELDAASHNGVGDIREITDGIRYGPVSARYKVLIMDEVHMVTNQAFNALLKTLEEPPAHAKFIFATTEIKKVPITILSRCQRFDLRRVDAALLVRHLASICEKERVAVDEASLAMIARAAEGSVRDALSLLDQAIAHGGGRVEAATVRQLLGLADRSRVIDLFEAVVRGDAAAALGEMRSQYDQGADPGIVLSEMAEFTHLVTRVKIVPEAARDGAVTEAERERGSALAGSLSMRVLTRLWQMLLKGVQEVQTAARPLAAAEMLLVRLCYAADLPTPDDLLRQLADLPPSPAGQGSPVAPAAQAPRLAPAPATSARPALAARAEPATQAVGAPVRTLASFTDIVALAMEKRDLPLKLAIERFVRLVSFENGRLEFALEPEAPQTLANEIGRKLSDWTNRRWMAVVSSEPGDKTLREQAEARQAAMLTGVRADPLVRAVMERFPGAEIVDVRDNEPVVEAAVPSDAGELTGDDSDYDADDI